MIIYVVTDSEEKTKSGGFYAHKFVLEKISGDICLIVRYDQLALKLLASLKPLAVCHSGCSTEFKGRDVLRHSAYRAAVTRWDGPQIGFCGGHQILAHMFGGKLGHIRKLAKLDADHNPGYHPGWFKEWGVYPVRILKRDPLFAGLGKIMRVQEFHRDEVKKLSPDLELLASSKDCRVQAFKHRNKPIYGTQFHPEQASTNYPDGLSILKNFFEIARNFQRHQQR